MQKMKLIAVGISKFRVSLCLFLVAALAFLPMIFGVSNTDNAIKRAYADIVLAEDPVSLSFGVPDNLGVAARTPGAYANGTTIPPAGGNGSDTPATVYLGGVKYTVIGRGATSGGGGTAAGVPCPTNALALLYNGPSVSSEFDASNAYTAYATSNLRSAIDGMVPAAREASAIMPRILEGGSSNCSNAASTTEVAINQYMDNASVAAYADYHYVDGGVMVGNCTFDFWEYHTARISGTAGMGSYGGSYHPDRIVDATSLTDVLWPLSVAEASLIQPSVRTYGGNWWLRSPGWSDEFPATCEYGYYVNFVFGDTEANSSLLVRPACYLDFSKVAFTSVASGSSAKSAATVGGEWLAASVLSDAQANAPGLKLTLQDSTLNMAADPQQTGYYDPATRTITFSYTGVTAGTNRYISAVIERNSTLAYYGKLANLGASAPGNATLTLPVDYNDATDVVKIFCEEANADAGAMGVDSPAATDFAGALRVLAIDTTPGTPVVPVVPVVPPADNNDITSGDLTARDGMPDTGVFLPLMAAFLSATLLLMGTNMLASSKKRGRVARYLGMHARVPRTRIRVRHTS